jgi:hypothetical protein
MMKQNAVLETAISVVMAKSILMLSDQNLPV